MNDFRQVVLGDMSIGLFLGCFFIALIAAAGLVFYRAINKADKAKGTPEGFSWKFFFWDNVPKWFLQVLTILVTIRLSNIALNETGLAAASFAIGLGSGQFSIWTQGRSNAAREDVAKQ